eukprot:763504-Hanusia_phi.AAC.6
MVKVRSLTPLGRGTGRNRSRSFSSRRVATSRGTCSRHSPAAGCCLAAARLADLRFHAASTSSPAPAAATAPGAQSQASGALELELIGVGRGGGDEEGHVEGILDDVAHFLDGKERPADDRDRRDHEQLHAVNEDERKGEAPDAEEARGVTGVGEGNGGLDDPLSVGDGGDEAADHRFCVSSALLQVRHSHRDLQRVHLLPPLGLLVDPPAGLPDPLGVGENTLENGGEHLADGKRAMAGRPDQLHVLFRKDLLERLFLAPAPLRPPRPQMMEEDDGVGGQQLEEVLAIPAPHRAVSDAA